MMKFLILKAVLASSIALWSAPVNAQMTVTVLGEADDTVRAEIKSILPESVRFATSSDELTISPSPNIVLHFMQKPDVSNIQETMRQLEQNGYYSVNILIVEEAENFNWLEPITVPDNVWTAVAVRSRDTMEVRTLYEATSVEYDGSGVEYDLDDIAAAAMRTVAMGQAQENFGQISRLGVLDPWFVRSGASETAQTNLLKKIELDIDSISPDTFVESGMHDARFLADGIQTDIEATAAFVMVNNCNNSDDWYPEIGPTLRLQTFDLRN